MFSSFKRIKKSNNIRMITLLENSHFKLGPSSKIIFTLQCFFTHWLDGNQLFTKLVHCKVYFAKSTLAKHSANPIKLTCCWRRLIKLFKVESKHFDKFLKVSIKLKLFFVTACIKLGKISNLRNYRRLERFSTLCHWS